MIDLHLHSTYSDGTLTPSELVKEAGHIGLSAISITDHDTVEGTQEAVDEGQLRSIEIIPGLEISVSYGALSLHVLGYNFNWLDDQLLTVLKRLQTSREQRNRGIIEKLQSIGIKINEKDLKAESGSGVAGRPHFARLLVKNGVVKNNEQAFKHYLKVGRCAYVPRVVLPVHEAIEIIHGAGGLAVWAHPVQLTRSLSDLSAMLTELKAMGLDGIETFYPTQRGKVGKILRNLAQKYHLLETGGSDYHGGIRTGTSMAGATKKFRVPAELLIELRK